MPQAQTYKMSALVLRKTKLGERDLIVTLLLETGALAKCVAKGARKPGGSFAAKLELFSHVDVMAARGRNLDVITDARFSKDTGYMTFGLEQATCAACLSELLTLVCQEDLEHLRLYDIAKAAFAAIAESSPAQALLITDAALVKVISVAGFKPQLDTCPLCGAAIDLDAPSAKVSFNVEEGGSVCSSCARTIEGGGLLTSANALAWTRALLYAKFDDVPEFDADSGIALLVLETVKPWLEYYGGRRLKSIDYLLASGLF